MSEALEEDTSEDDRSVATSSYHDIFPRANQGKTSTFFGRLEHHTKRSGFNQVSPSPKKLKQTARMGPAGQVTRPRLPQPSVAEFYENTVRPGALLKNYAGPNRTFLNLMKTMPLVVYVIDVMKGLFTLLYVNEFGKPDEGNVFPILRAMGVVEEATYSRKTEAEKAFYKEGNLIAVAPRRSNKAENAFVWKRSLGTPGPSYQKAVVGVAVLDNNTKDAKENLCNKTVRLLKASGINAEVKKGFDQTHENFKSLDHFITDECCVRLIQSFWKRGPVDRTFYEYNPTYRDYVFSKPYPLIAHAELGYPLDGEVETFNPPMKSDSPNRGQGLLHPGRSTPGETDDEVQEVPNPAGKPDILEVDIDSDEESNRDD